MKPINQKKNTSKLGVVLLESTSPTEFRKICKVLRGVKYKYLDAQVNDVINSKKKYQN